MSMKKDMDSEMDGFQYVRFFPLPIVQATEDSGSRDGRRSKAIDRLLADNNTQIYNILYK